MELVELVLLLGLVRGTIGGVADVGGSACCLLLLEVGVVCMEEHEGWKWVVG